MLVPTLLANAYHKNNTNKIFFQPLSIMLFQRQWQSSTHVRYIFMLITQRDAKLRPTDCRSSLEERDILLSSLSLELCAQI